MNINGKVRKLKYISALLLVISGAASGDTGAFSALSFGDLDPTLSSSSGIAISDSLLIRNHNYASWTGLANTTFSVSASFYYNKLSAGDGVSSEFDRFTFEDMSFAMPFGEGNVLGFSYYPEAVVDITGVTADEETIPESFEDTAVRTLETRKGSLSNASLIYARAFGGLSLSIDPSFLFGNYEISRRYGYTSYVEGTDIVDWEKYFEDKSTVQLFHFRMGGGFLYSLPYGIGIGSRFCIPVYSYVNRIDKFSRTTSYGTVTDTVTESEYGIKDAEWPAEMGLGLTYGYKHLVFSYDLSAKFFEGVNTGIDDYELNDYIRNTFGISLRQRTRRYDPYYKRMAYSGYLTVEKRPYEYNPDPDDLNPVYDITGTLGLNFPFNRDMTAVELKLGYTVSGSEADNGMENRIFRLSLNFISSDRWALRKQKYND